MNKNEEDHVDVELAALFEAGSEDGSDSDSDSPIAYQDKELNDTLTQIGNIISCLLRLSVTISNPAPHDRFKSRVGAEMSLHFEPFDVQHARNKFPHIDDKLSERLGRALSQRRRYLRYREDHHSRLSHGLEDRIDDGASKGQATTVASSLPQGLKDDGAEANLKWLDDTRSEISATSYAPSDVDQSDLRVPPIPKEYTDGPFLCPFCFCIIAVETRLQWKKHVFRDLRPYICLAEKCVASKQDDFSRRKDWIYHMSREHWTTWVCPFGCNGEHGSPSRVRNHLKDYHATEIAGENFDTILDLSRKDDAKRAEGPCPLCHDVRTTSTRHYQTHVAHHLENLALFVLPQQDDNEDHDISDGTSSSPPDGDPGLRMTEEDEGAIKCICSYDHDDGASVFCEGCSTWQHIDCYYHPLEEAEKVKQEDFDHLCVDCNPRSLDSRQARERQTKRREFLQARQEREYGKQRDYTPFAETDKNQDGAGQSKDYSEQYFQNLEGHESVLGIEKDAEIIPSVSLAERGRLLETNSKANSPSSVSPTPKVSPKVRDPEEFATEDMHGPDTGAEANKERAKVAPSDVNESIEEFDEGRFNKSRTGGGSRGGGGVYGQRFLGNWYCCICKFTKRGGLYRNANGANSVTFRSHLRNTTLV
ncbi:SET domain-containing protein 3 [Diaporthe australafricana]|uniref:SET domain-containing protein 3 n=1 Tax=Diaporthe australafricana TaxID=127596 RepID=A0ABR3VYA7_9PEZI